jgi:hypothetical protein
MWQSITSCARSPARAAVSTVGVETTGSVHERCWLPASSRTLSCHLRLIQKEICSNSDFREQLSLKANHMSGIQDHCLFQNNDARLYAELVIFFCHACLVLQDCVDRKAVLQLSAIQTYPWKRPEAYLYAVQYCLLDHSV